MLVFLVFSLLHWWPAYPLPLGDDSCGERRREASLLTGCGSAAPGGRPGHRFTLALHMVLQRHDDFFEYWLLLDKLDFVHLDMPDTNLHGTALHVAVVAAAGAPLYLHAGWPHHEVGIGAVHHVTGDLKDHRPRLALGEDSWLCCCQSIKASPLSNQGHMVLAGLSCIQVKARARAVLLYGVYLQGALEVIDGAHGAATQNVINIFGYGVPLQAGQGQGEDDGEDHAEIHAGFRPCRLWAHGRRAPGGKHWQLASGSKQAAGPHRLSTGGVRGAGPGGSAIS